MGRILAIDYGRKKSGVAVSDPFKIIANALDTFPSHKLMEFLEKYVVEENVELIVFGKPTQVNGEDSESMKYITPFYNRLKKQLPQIPVVWVDERFTSKIAFQTMIDGGVKKKDRRNKELVDKISAVIILQSYMESIR